MNEAHTLFYNTSLIEQQANPPERNIGTNRGLQSMGDITQKQERLSFFAPFLKPLGPLVTFHRQFIPTDTAKLFLNLGSALLLVHDNSYFPGSYL
jgi:hypothetical protein